MSKNSPQNASPDEHLYALDGFRALLAIWVYLGHLSYAVGFENYMLGLHALAVDLFMVLSGFLMVRSWGRINAHGASLTHRILSFYCVRFFRIAPLYYLLLLICYLFLPSLGQMSDFVQKTMPPPWAQGLSSYEPHAGWDFNNLKWLLLHATFTFGLVPGMEASTPLPDWSLSLEMQFYLIFPFLVAAISRIPILVISVLVAGMAFASPTLFGNYLSPGTLTHFGQPSLLTYRLNAFFAGMLIAYLLNSLRLGQASSNISKVLILLSCAICIGPMSKPVILAYFVFGILAARKVPYFSALLSCAPLRLLGTISYSVYLIHILIVIPTVYWMFSIDGFLALAAINRFLLAGLISAPIVFILSYASFRFVESPFMRMGKSQFTKN